MIGGLRSRSTRRRRGGGGGVGARRRRPRCLRLLRLRRKKSKPSPLLLPAPPAHASGAASLEPTISSQPFSLRSRASTLLRATQPASWRSFWAPFEGWYESDVFFFLFLLNATEKKCFFLPARRGSHTQKKTKNRCLCRHRRYGTSPPWRRRGSLRREGGRYPKRQMVIHQHRQPGKGPRRRRKGRPPLRPHRHRRRRTPQTTTPTRRRRRRASLAGTDLSRLLLPVGPRRPGPRRSSDSSTPRATEGNLRQSS